MARPLNSPDRLFDRTWRAGHPFRPRLSAGRRWTMGLLLLLLASIIGGYWYVTDSHRVRKMAESYLSDLLGGRVEVGKATLSIFQGLRLEDVRIFVEKPRGEKGNEETSLFSAQAFEIQYNPQTLLSGKLEATQIKVIDPRVHLTENVKTGHWSFQRLKPRTPHSDEPPKIGSRPPVLPEIVLRNARVEYSQTGGLANPQTSAIMLEGQFTPSLERDTYHFRLQSRGESEGIGPSIDGSLVMGTRQVKAKLSNFVIGPDVKAMLAAEVRKWVDDHQLAGAVDAELDYRPNEPDHRFHVQMDLSGVTLTIHPEEWMSADEIRRLAITRQSLSIMSLAGVNTALPGGNRQPFINAPFVDHLDRLLEPSPLQVDNVAGKFIFSQQGIDIEDGRGRVESNGFLISGHVGGYNPSAPVHLHVTSPLKENIFVPAAPRYVGSMPAPVREVYDRFKPQGTCSFWVDIDRPTSGTPDVVGEMNIINGQFSYEKFTYPVRNVTGRIAVGRDANGEPSMKLEHIHGHGLEGGPNANADFEINGWMAPIGPEVEIHIDIAGKNVSSEPALTAALPRGTQKALKIFDAPGRGELPKYKGGFSVNIERELGRTSHWHFLTKVHLDDASGTLVGFPYPLNGVSADLSIANDRLEVINASMRRGNASLKLDGSVSWGSTTQPSEPFVQKPAADAAATQETQPDLQPDLHIVAKNVPIDRDLLNALPADRRDWLEKLGIGGTIDVDGTITAPPKQSDAADAHPASPSDLNIDLAIDWRDGTLSPNGGPIAASGLAGSLHLMPQKLVLRDLQGHRGAADLSARGTIAWPNDHPQLALSAEASNLQLDKDLYALLPDTAKKGWDAVNPEGTLDATIHYSGAIGSTALTAGGSAPVTTRAALSEPPSSTGGFEVTLTPRKLAATTDAVPYRLTDLTGSVTIQPDLVTLKDIVGKHGGASVRVSGTGGMGPAGVWDLHLSAADMLIDDDLRRAAPSGLASLLQSTQLQGKIAFEFSKLRISPPPPATQPTTAAAPATSPANAALNVDFAVKVRATDASLDVGVPLSHFNGTSEFAGTSEAGKLRQLTGAVDGTSAQLSERRLTDLHLTLNKPAGYDLLQVQNIQGKMADGEVAGQVEWAFPDNAPSRYAVGMVLHGADVRQLTGEKNTEIHGRLSASLAVEGTYNDAKSRRGRGDVSVTGSDMYHIPLVLGLLQITNLALPITSPFNEATARYSIEGQRVNFEKIELRAKEMMMQGNGHLDFDTKKVKMTFTTDNTTWPKLPIIGDLISTARHELLQIHVNGTLQDPKVSASAMNTLTTTVDEVFKGDDADTGSNGKPNRKGSY